MAKHEKYGSSMKMVDPTMAAVGTQPQGRSNYGSCWYTASNYLPTTNAS
jgi:hypothetical protein